MCYYEQIRWACGYWRWGRFRQQCDKECGTGETCDLKIVYEIRTEPDVCELCYNTEEKQRQYDEMHRDLQRWQHEGNRSATIERTTHRMQEIMGQISRMRVEHDHRVRSHGQDPDTTGGSELATSHPAGPVLSSTSLPRPDLPAGLPIPSEAEAETTKLSSASKTGAEPSKIGQETPESVASKEDAISYGSLNSVSEALAYNNVDLLSDFLEQRPEIASSGDYGWIAELKDIGYSSTEIAGLLYERANDSPWIYFESKRIAFAFLIPHRHIKGCAHQLLESSSESSPKGVLGPSPALNSDLEVVRLIEEYCGLGGVAPSSRDPRRWNGTAEFQEENSVALIRHHLSSSSTASIQDTISRLLQVARNFGNAIRTAQDAGFCCDSFTILCISSTRPEAICPELQLSRIKLSWAQEITSCVRFLDFGDGEGHKVMKRVLYSECRGILSHVLDTSHFHKIQTTEDILNVVSLTLQFLSLGFLSYTQAHIGMLQPFFLDTPLRRLVLLGTQATPELYITASLVELTCLSGMTEGPVIAFGGSSLEGHVGTMETRKYDVRAFPQDILDTWGPGELVYRPEDKETFLAIKIGHGYICPPSQDGTVGKYHWDGSVNFLPTSPSLKPDKEIVIGSLISENLHCNNDEKKCWQESARRFDQLGVYDSYYKRSEVQGGFQLGWDQLAITSNVVWAKRPGRTIKDKSFETGAYMSSSFLEFYWGVRVSFCTGVAQRVLLRELVADLLPAFAECSSSQTHKSWWDKLSGPEHQIIERFKGTVLPEVSLSDWLENLPKDLRKFVRALIKHIFDTLKDTGLSPDGRYFSVAWPQRGFVTRGFRVSVNEHNRWMPMLADSADCATFAYISNNCLEVGDFKCRGPNPSWQDRVHLLETAVHCPVSTGSWGLQPEQAYFFHKVDNELFWVKARRDAAAGTLPVALVRTISIRSLPSDVIRRLLFTGGRRMQRLLRERDLTWVTAENVYVL
ncbi:hypothetical protein AK830_g4722 [Neonectria ditissima]|uniref:Uncharacterized protein n=1 Tax=Neonectria ditissima TaxID=78410 RepID=A0A0N8H7I6_9HYPO|nr:hypothetical protein AK830_g4722 [Neonectria ditissima]